MLCFSRNSACCPTLRHEIPNSLYRRHKVSPCFRHFVIWECSFNFVNSPNSPYTDSCSRQDNRLSAFRCKRVNYLDCRFISMRKKEINCAALMRVYWPASGLRRKTTTSFKVLAHSYVSLSTTGGALDS